MNIQEIHTIYIWDKNLNRFRFFRNCLASELIPLLIHITILFRWEFSYWKGNNVFFNPAKYPLRKKIIFIDNTKSYKQWKP